jgi:hypothetical protein
VDPVWTPPPTIPVVKKAMDGYKKIKNYFI